MTQTARRVRTTCNRDCPDACGIIATVEDGRVTQLKGDPDHPVTKGFLCYRTNRFLERQYDPNRITTPLRRRGSDFEPIAWDEALDSIAERMQHIRAESGPAAMLVYSCGGSLGLLKCLTDWFFERFGPVTIKSGDICSGAGEAAQLADFGESDSNDVFDLINSETIVLWGKNPYVSSVHLLPILHDAKARGARLVLIDPVYHKTAALCDLYVQPRPGGDIALGLAVARTLFETGRTDSNASDYCDNLDAFRTLAFSRSLDAWAKLADVTPDQVRALADLYANGPTALLLGWGMQRRTNGCATIRVLDALAAVTGNLGVSGGGASFYFKRRGAFDTSFVKRAAVAPRAIPEARLGLGILEATDPPVRMVWVSNANPVAMLPDSHAVARALETRELTVVVDAFLTDTARCADIVLPTTTMLEDDDLVGAFGHHWLAEVRPVVAAPDGVKTDYEIIQALAARVGLADDFADSVDTWKRRLLGRVADRGASLEDLRNGPVRNPEARKILFADRRFPTPTGRVDLIRDADPEPARPTVDRPLLLTSVSTEKSQASQWPARKQQGPATAVIHPDAANGFADGDLARIESELGEMTVRLKLDPRQRRDVILVEKGGWLSAGRCANALVPAVLTDAGGGAAYYDTPVRLRRADP